MAHDCTTQTEQLSRYEIIAALSAVVRVGAHFKKGVPVERQEQAA
jgi:hypothetical protein